MVLKVGEICSADIHEEEKMPDKIDRTDANRDPLTGAPGAHPVGAGLGAAVGTAVGAAAGALGGPAGMAAGAAVGAAVVAGLAGGLAGKAAGEKFDPTVEDAYWATSYVTAPYVTKGTAYETYQPAYRYGWESYDKNRGKTFDDVELELARDWDKHRGTSSLSWSEARAAARDAWDRMERALPGDADGDGR
jgi:hypothetical protein